MLTDRQRQILKLIVADYVASAVPVGSRFIVERHALGVSPATVRNDMGTLEEEGYITRPHTSGGGVPSDQGYRYYVRSLLEGTHLPETQRAAIRRRFQDLEPEFEVWCEAAAAVLSVLAHNAAVVTVPRALEAHVRQVQLLSLQETLALLVLVLQEAKLKQQLLPLPAAASQEDLTRASNRLNLHLAGRNRNEISALTIKWSDLEGLAAQAVQRLLKEEDDLGSRTARVDGVRHALAQPEFASVDKARELVEALEEREHLTSLLVELAENRGLTVVIGDEVPNQSLRQCSVIAATYGRSSDVSGALGVIGPTRMDYSRTLAAVAFLRDLLDELLGSVYTGERS